MPNFKLRRCDRCNKYHASYVVDDPQRGKINLCTIAGTPKTAACSPPPRR